MLKNNDVDFNKKIRILDNNYDSYYRENNKLIIIDKYNIDNDLIKNIEIKCLTKEELWNYKKVLLFEYCNENKIIPLENIIYKHQKLGNWYKSQKNKIKHNLLDNINLYNELIKNFYVKNDLFNYTDLIESKVEIKNNYTKNNLHYILKKYSTIPNQFLDDFYKIFNHSTINSNEINIDLDNVIKWLQIQKHSAKDTLIKSYKKGIDYEIKKVIKLKGSGGQKREIITITVNCFKKICQLTRSKKGNEVREYFIQVESLLNKYKDYIINGMQDKIIKLEKDQKPKLNPEKGVIYIFRTPNSTENSLYKIGRTKDLKKRLQSHQSSLAHDIEVLFYYESENIVKIEKCIKLLMKDYQYRKYKEVYKINIDIIKSLVQQCDSIIIDTEQKVKLSELKDEGDKLYYVNISK
jgi:phage anti-repressor protein/predicted GIY-YIG superfamily endonuclease